MLERVLVALLAEGHLLLEGVPGLAKTLTIKTSPMSCTARSSASSSRPTWCQPTLSARASTGRMTAPSTPELGPVFANFLLADEINRAPAKVQSALLEVMQERQVTIGPTTHPVPRPFLVMATQNPIESEGTYPLPEAQVDRFMLKVLLDYPSPAEEVTVVERSLESPAEVLPILSARALRRSRPWRARSLSTAPSSTTRSRSPTRPATRTATACPSSSPTSPTGPARAARST